MCGIGGILVCDNSLDWVDAKLNQLQGALKHRGPDSHGVWLSENRTFGFVHTRLSIQDLSNAGHQPMHSADGRYTIVFNGEIYNFRELRKGLISRGYSFFSDSDTEVLLAMFQEYGDSFVSQLSGMYAVAIADHTESSVFFARDPLGIKPLYFLQTEDTFAFASEVRALVELELVPRQLNPNAVNGYLLYGSVPEPDTIITGIESLKAGHWMKWKSGKTETKSFWKLNRGKQIDKDQALSTAKTAFEDTVARHLVSDVPVGVFLSGGIDSTALVAVMRRIGVQQIKTFSISFDDDRYNEGDDAKRTADHFNTEHHDWRMTAEIGKGMIKQFLIASDQPSIDGFNTFCVSKLASDHGMKVVLSGLGGDELFGGYPSFQTVPFINKCHRWMSSLYLAHSIGKGIERFSRQDSWKRLGVCLQSRPEVTAAYWAMRGIFTPQESNRIRRAFVSDFKDDDDVQSMSNRESLDPSILPDSVSELELTRYMRNQLLRDSDVMSMYWGLELRVPFVDRRFVDAIWTIPTDIRLKKGKQLLIDSVPELPEWVINRPKRGFVFPFEQWAKESFAKDFKKVQSESPVQLNTWYRSWAIMALMNFMKVNEIDSSERTSSLFESSNS